MRSRTSRDEDDNEDDNRTTTRAPTGLERGCLTESEISRSERDPRGLCRGRELLEGETSEVASRFWMSTRSAPDLMSLRARTSSTVSAHLFLDQIPETPPTPTRCISRVSLCLADLFSSPRHLREWREERRIGAIRADERRLRREESGGGVRRCEERSHVTSSRACTVRSLHVVDRPEPMLSITSARCSAVSRFPSVESRRSRPNSLASASRIFRRDAPSA